MKLKSIICTLLIGCMLSPTALAIGKKEPPQMDMPQQYPAKYTDEYLEQLDMTYKKVTKARVIEVALDMLKGTNGDFSRNAIMGNNLTQKPVIIQFKDLASIDEKYRSFDALGWKKKKRLYVYINMRHQDAPPAAIAALLAHEALHQDEYNSLNEETYAWTMEAAVWSELSDMYPQYQETMHPLVNREKTLKKLFERGDYTNKYIKKTVYSNPGYQNLPMNSPGFENL